MKISVYGSAAGEMPPDIKAKAREIGKEIAIRGHELLTGACPGLSYEAVIGANENGGTTIGFSPATSLEDHRDRFHFPTERFSRLVFVSDTFQYKDNKQACLKLRNVYSVSECDAAIIISGRFGTANEFTLAYDMGKNIGVLKGSKGFTDFITPMMEAFNKPSGSEVIFREIPFRLVRGLEGITTT